MEDCLSMGTKNHEQYHKFHVNFQSDVKALVSAFNDTGNMFLGDSGQLVALDTAKVMDQAVVDFVSNIHAIGKQKHLTFSNERILTHEIPWTATIPMTILHTELKLANKRQKSEH